MQQKITLTRKADLLQMLQNKLKEYQERKKKRYLANAISITMFTAPELVQTRAQFLEEYKLNILNGLLEKGQITKDEAIDICKNVDGNSQLQCPGQFNSAWLVIASYNAGDTRHIKGGTGLK